MSGPKIDAAELERRKQAELERQRQERLRRIRIATEELEAVHANIRKHISYVDSYYQKLMEQVQKQDEMQQVLRKIKQCKDTYLHGTRKLLNLSVPTEADDIIQRTEDVKRAEKQAFENYSMQTAPLYSRIDSFLAAQRELESLLQTSYQNEGSAVESIADFDFRKCKDSIKEQIGDEQAKALEIDRLFERIENLINSDSISVPERQELYQLAMRLHSNADASKGVFQALVAESNIVLDQIQLNVESFEEAYQKYYSEYVSYLEIINRRRAVKWDIVPKERHRFASLLELQRERDIIEERSRAANEHNYIRSQIDEVMQEVGYDTTDEIVFRSNQTGAHYICKNDSTKTAIHIHLSDSKQIMMEIVATDTAQRTDDSEINGVSVNYKELSGEQCDELLLEQGRFCQLHPEIVEKLRKRGVILDVRSRKKPALEYCKTIFKLEGDFAFQEDQDGIINTITGNEHVDFDDVMREMAKK